MRTAPSIALAFALCFVTSCESQDEPADAQTVTPPAPTQPPIGSWVLVSQRRLYMTPSTNAHIVVDSKAPYRLAEVVEFPSDKFVHLRSLAVTRDVPCATNSGNDPNFELHFFASLDALRPVLNQRKVVEFDDGTRLELQPGVPVEMAEEGAKLKIGDVEFIVDVRSHEVRNWFPAPPLEPPSLGIPVQWSRDRPLYYGERNVASFKPPFVFARARQKLEDGGELLSFADPCGRYTLRAEPGPPVFESKPPSHGDPIIGKPGIAASGGAIGNDEQPDPCIVRRTRDLGMLYRAVLTWAASDRAAGWISGGIELPPITWEYDGKICFTAVEMPVCIPSEEVYTDERDDCRVRREGSWKG
jgi:hypothetical protein